MRSFGSALALAVVVAVSLRAQSASPTGGGALRAGSGAAAVRPQPAAPPAVPALLAQQVVGAIAHQWGDDSARLQLAWGLVPGGVAFPRGTAARVVGRGDGGWFTAVFNPPGALPFAVRVRAGAPDSMTVATRTLDAGRELTAGDLQRVPETRWGPPPDTAAPRVGPGWITRRLVMTGTLLTSNTAAPPPLVRRGDQVRLEWRRGAVLITLEGTALDAGAAGQAVRVRVGQNPDTKSGIVLGTGTVRLDS